MYLTMPDEWRKDIEVKTDLFTFLKELNQCQRQKQYTEIADLIKNIEDIIKSFEGKTFKKLQKEIDPETVGKLSALKIQMKQILDVFTKSIPMTSSDTNMQYRN